MEESGSDPHGIERDDYSMRSSTVIADIGVDCLEHIFGDFELGDLISVAQVSHQFREAAGYIFVRNYSTKRIVIKCNGFRRVESLNIYDSKNNKNLLLTDLKTSLQVLRCFGNNVTDVHFEFKTVIGDVDFRLLYANVISYINQYCADTLKCISIDPVNTEFANLCSEPFTEVESVVLFMGTLDMFSLNRLFPKMESLNLQWYYLDGEQSMVAEHYSHLRNFEFNLNKFSRSVASFIKNTLALNDRVQSLKLCVPRLFYKTEAITLSYVKELIISEFDSLKNTKIPFRLKRLQTVTLKKVDASHMRNYHNLIRKHHKSIQKIIFDSCSRKVFQHPEYGFMTNNQWLKDLLSLKEIIVKSYVTFPVDYVQKCMQDFENLQCFTFFCSSSDDQIKVCCDYGWDVLYLESPAPITSGFTVPFVKLTRIPR